MPCHVVLRVRDNWFRSVEAWIASHVFDKTSTEKLLLLLLFGVLLAIDDNIDDVDEVDEVDDVDEKKN